MERIKRGRWSSLLARITGAPQYRITISGDMESFKGLGQNANRLAELVESDQIVTFAVAERYRRKDGANPMVPGGIGLTGSDGYNPAQVVVHPNSSRFDPDRAGIINGAFGTIPGANIAEATAHELLGHAWAEMIMGYKPGTTPNFRAAIDAENAVRRTDPSRGQKTRHHHAPPLFSQQELQKMLKRE
jgi:hypothetical protein